MRKKKKFGEEKKSSLEENFFFFLSIKVFFNFLHFLRAGLHLVTTVYMQKQTGITTLFWQ